MTRLWGDWDEVMSGVPLPTMPRQRKEWWPDFEGIETFNFSTTAPNMIIPSKEWWPDFEGIETLSLFYGPLPIRKVHSVKSDDPTLRGLRHFPDFLNSSGLPCQRKEWWPDFEGIETASQYPFLFWFRFRCKEWWPDFEGIETLFYSFSPPYSPGLSKEWWPDFEGIETNHKQNTFLINRIRKKHWPDLEGIETAGLRLKWFRD